MFGGLPKADITIRWGVIIENSLGFHINWLKIQLKGVGVAIICIWPCSQMSRVVVHDIQRSVSGDLWLLGNNIRPKVAQKSAKVGFWAVYRPSIVYNGDTLSRPSIKLWVTGMTKNTSSCCSASYMTNSCHGNASACASLWWRQTAFFGHFGV